MHETEKKAMDVVMKYEKKQGRNPKDVHLQRDIPYDIKSGKRCIEVKGTKDKRPTWVTMTDTLTRKIGKDLINYFVYIVYDIYGKPKLMILDFDAIFSHLETYVTFIITAKNVNKYGKNVKL